MYILHHHQGYSIRSVEWRYTEWRHWDNISLTADWTQDGWVSLAYVRRCIAWALSLSFPFLFFSFASSPHHLLPPTPLADW